VTNVSIEVRDESGHVVKTIENQPGTMGLHEVKVTDLATGKYKVIVNAKDAGGNDVSKRISIGDLVTGVNFSGNVPNLLLASGGEMPASQLIEIRQPRSN
jgi:flagellar hook assembly protein FlgD